MPAVHVLTEVPCQIDPEELRRELCVEQDTQEAATLEALLGRARAVARPKALFREVLVQDGGPDTVLLGGLPFSSPVLKRLLQGTPRVFPFVATCGREIDALETAPVDILEGFWLEAVKGAALRSSLEALDRVLREHYGLEAIGTLSPGSGEETVWPLEQQRQLFRLLEDVPGLIGVSLTPACLMRPTQSLSGIRFHSRGGFSSCQLCRRRGCPLRQAAFDRRLWDALHRA